MTDWDAIQADYEQGGMSVRALAAKYDVAPTTLYDRSRKWSRTPEQPKTRTPEHVQLKLVKAELPSPPNAVEGANLGIDSLIAYLKANRARMDLSDHAKAANALWQYNRIVVNAPPQDDEQDEEQEDYTAFTDEELAVYAELQERAKRKHA